MTTRREHVWSLAGLLALGVIAAAALSTAGRSEFARRASAVEAMHAATPRALEAIVDVERVQAEEPPSAPQPDQVRHRGHDYDVVGFDLLASFPCETPDLYGEHVDLDAAVRQLDAAVPPAIRALDGHRVAVDGFMLPLLVKKERVSSFLLLKDQGGCCFGIAPPMNGWVHVTMAGGRTTEPYNDVPLRVYGTLAVGAKAEPFGGVSLYRLNADALEVLDPPGMQRFGE